MAGGLSLGFTVQLELIPELVICEEASSDQTIPMGSVMGSDGLKVPEFLTADHTAEHGLAGRNSGKYLLPGC